MESRNNARNIVMCVNVGTKLKTGIENISVLVFWVVAPYVQGHTALQSGRPASLS
jgi:hypothetical protein